MGSEICVAFSECGYLDCFTAGVGMMYGDLEFVVERVNWRRRERVQQIIRNHDVTDTEYGTACIDVPSAISCTGGST